MRRTDVAVIGGGLAGSTAAAMLGRAGIDAVLIDPHVTYPSELRCEKLDGSQVEILRRTGLAEEILPATTHDQAVWVARFGRLVEKRPSDQRGILYDALVNAMRAAVPAAVPFVHAKATAIAPSEDRQSIALSTGEEISARLVVIANGLNIGLRHALGMPREELSKCHSITVAFDLKPADRAAFAFPALTYYAERHTDRMAYLTLFPVGAAMRANLMLYRGMDDPWFRDLRAAPEAALRALMPKLTRLTGPFDVIGPMKIRPADLTMTQNVVRAGVVLVGDAYATSCPAAGTGAGKVLNDVERLCNVYIPRWLASSGMGETKIAAFYADPVKQAYDSFSYQKAYTLRSLSTDASLPWRMRRWSRFLARRLAWEARQVRDLFVGAPPQEAGPPRERAGEARTA